MSRKYGKQTIKVEVFFEGEAPPAWDDLNDLHELISEGDVLGNIEVENGVKFLSVEELTAECERLGSDISFFAIDVNDDDSRLACKASGRADRTGFYGLNDDDDEDEVTKP